jgi:hypothetical protein
MAELTGVFMHVHNHSILLQSWQSIIDMIKHAHNHAVLAKSGHNIFEFPVYLSNPGALQAYHRSSVPTGTHPENPGHGKT